MNDENKNISKMLYGDNIGRVQLIQHWGSDATIVRSARVSFGRDSGSDVLSDKDERLIQYLIKHRHTSTLEHCGATFKFVVPLFVRSQHHRHRTWSYNEISRRYTDVNIKFYEPNSFRTQHKSNRQASNLDSLINPAIIRQNPESTVPHQVPASMIIKDHHEQSLRLYDELLDAGICREQARGVLPQNLYTEYYGSVNLNNLLKFIDLRTHEGAQWEIQQVARACLDMATDLWPTSVIAYRKIRG
jgi:thymidylate synthase (FAD)